MFINSTFSAIEADAHRQALIAEAENYRLAKLVRSARRRARRAGTRVTVAPSPPPRPDGEHGGDHNLEADRRYAVSR